jgi:ADP-ribosylglycohydrolase
VGDAAGATLEFWRGELTDRDVEWALSMPGGGALQVAPGQITDDGELALSLSRALARERGRYRPDAVAGAYVAWARSGPFDMGLATSRAFAHGRSTRRPAAVCRAEAGGGNGTSKSNGALMRVVPLAVASARWTEETALKWARYDAALSHPNPSCLQANAAYVLAVRHLILHRGDVDGALSACRAYLAEEPSEVLQWIDDATEGRLADAKALVGFVRHGFTRAFFHLHRRSGFREALVHTLLAGGDTDTNGCIVAGLVGAMHGLGGLLSEQGVSDMVEAVLTCNTKAGHHRPEGFHASKMAEHVVAICG